MKKFVFLMSLMASPLLASESLLLKLGLARDIGQAVLGVGQLRRSTLEMTESLFNPDENFREKEDYYAEYSREVSDLKEIKRLRQGDPRTLNAEIAVLIRDLETFLATAEMTAKIDDFIERGTETLEKISEVETKSSFMLRSVLSMFIPMGEASSEFLAFSKQIISLKAEFAGKNSDDDKKAIYAGIFILASVFHNGGDRISYLYDNKKVVAHLVTYVESKYGSNPLLRFAREAPTYDASRRQMGIGSYEGIRSFLSRYRWSLAIAFTAVGAMVTTYMRAHAVPGA